MSAGDTPEAEADAVETLLESLAPAEALIGRYGLVSRVVDLTAEDARGGFKICVAEVGNVSAAADGDGDWHHSPERGNIDGVGVHPDLRVARLLAVVEALERYALCSWHPADLTVAPETALVGSPHVSPRFWSKPSEAELRSCDSGLYTYDPNLPIRWARGWSLTEQRETLVPAAAVYMHMQPISRSERFIYSTTTGAAAHRTLGDAALGGLVEIAERESIALTWLHQLPLSEIQAPREKSHQAGSLETRFFDATTDLGVPTVYALQTSGADQDIAQVVAAAAATTPHRAVQKVRRELAAIRVALRAVPQRTSRPPMGSVSVTGGAAWLAQREMRHHFDFLLGPREKRRQLARNVALETNGIDYFVERLQSLGMEAVVLDMTPREGARVGFRVAKVICPQAVPVSFVSGMPFTDCSRLFEVPGRMGLPARRLGALNKLPQPFA